MLEVRTYPSIFSTSSFALRNIRIAGCVTRSEPDLYLIQPRGQHRLRVFERLNLSWARLTRPRPEGIANWPGFPSCSRCCGLDANVAFGLPLAIGTHWRRPDSQQYDWRSFMRPCTRWFISGMFCGQLRGASPQSHRRAQSQPRFPRRKKPLCNCNSGQRAHHRSSGQ
jgi:hypothetical protein